MDDRMTSSAPAAAQAGNPLLQAWTGPADTPPFAAISPADFKPAFETAMAEQLAEIEAIAGETAAPSFANTIAALERSGRALAKVSAVFQCLAGAHTNADIQALEREMSPRLAAHRNRIQLNPGLYARIEALWDHRGELGLSPEEARVLERYELTFRRAGAGLGAAEKERVAAIGERLASLGTAFSQNVLADEQSYALVLETEDDLAGLSAGQITAAKEAAQERGHAGKYAITLARSSVEPFLTSSTRRDLREKAYLAWIARGDGGGATDNKAIIAETVQLRAERARLLGYPNFARYRLDDSMAKTPEAVRGLLERVWTPARARAMADRDALQELAQAEGGNFALAPWDWRFYAEKLRKARFDVDQAEIAPYLSLDNMIAAAFDTAGRLFGLSFHERHDVPVWHPDVRVWEVRGPGDRHVGLFFGDYFARSSKRGGAWMTTLRVQEKLSGDIRPLVVNVMNFAKAGGGAPTLLSFDDARTLFHEFGHGLHGLLSDVTYPVIACTRVATDFVELPSQLYEHWLEEPEVLRRFARHYETGAPMPEDLIARALAARRFNQGFATVEYLASALVDLEYHLLEGAQARDSAAPDPAAFDPAAFEARVLRKIGMPGEIAMRHRSPHFQHVFSGGGYAAGYYSYMWSEVLDADAFEAFKETGDAFDPATATRLRDDILAAGGSRDPADAYTAFRGRLPSPDALLRKRGFAEVAA
jgi:peptidyl-dipeptidase Dcp